MVRVRKIKKYITRWSGDRIEVFLSQSFTQQNRKSVPHNEKDPYCCSVEINHQEGVQKKIRRWIHIKKERITQEISQQIRR